MTGRRDDRDLDGLVDALLATLGETAVPAGEDGDDALVDRVLGQLAVTGDASDDDTRRIELASAAAVEAWLDSELDLRDALAAPDGAPGDERRIARAARAAVAAWRPRRRGVGVARPLAAGVALGWLAAGTVAMAAVGGPLALRVWLAPAAPSAPATPHAPAAPRGATPRAAEAAPRPPAPAALPVDEAPSPRASERVPPRAPAASAGRHGAAPARGGPAAGEPGAASPPPGDAPPHDPSAEPDAMLRRANESRAAGDVAAAIEAYRALQRAHPTSRAALISRVSLGRLLLDGGRDAAAALASFDAYLEAAPTGAVAEAARSGRALALEALGRAAEARRAWEEVLRLHPDSPSALRARARLAE